MPKGGRPTTPADQRAVPVGLEQQTVAILDEIIGDRLRKEQRAGQEDVRKRAAADGKRYRLERDVNPSVERRRLVGEIVTWYQRIHTALTVKVVAPCESDDPEMRREADEWATTLEERLTDEAPAGVRFTLLERALRRGVQPDPDTVTQVLRSLRAAKSENRDDGETS